MYQIGIDIGGTNVKIGLLNEALELCAEISIPFPHTTAEDMAAQIRAAVGPMLQARGAALSDVESLGAVVPGSIDAAGETVVDAHNLNFHNVPLRKILSDAFPGIPVYIANDANGAALAELYTGAFVGCKTGVLLTLGTGLGGGIILNGKMFNGGMNHGVELGHAYLVDGGEPCRPTAPPPPSQETAAAPCRHTPRACWPNRPAATPARSPQSSSPTAQRRATRRRRPCSTRISSI